MEKSFPTPAISHQRFPEEQSFSVLLHWFSVCKGLVLDTFFTGNLLLGKSSAFCSNFSISWESLATLFPTMLCFLVPSISPERFLILPLYLLQGLLFTCLSLKLY
ncbi:hypothetical protein DSO57_1024022 [Entomophthora muscae]|uniref:Uncharacterized protein n=1 Tax=Entomophthora muscae TaxID=34485 RepID=A0ACC2TDT4_9FUNG|nr:hypothetical protein DSO57_1024022 [Entomophthora muscae]